VNAYRFVKVDLPNFGLEKEWQESVDAIRSGSMSNMVDTLFHYAGMLFPAGPFPAGC
jgi:hypothetical protein